MVLNPVLSKSMEIGNPTSCPVLYVKGINTKSSFEFLIGDLKCKGKNKGLVKIHSSSQRVSTLRPFISLTSYSSSCRGDHYNLWLRKVLQSYVRKYLGGLGLDLDSLFPLPLVGRPRTIRKSQELDMREVK